MEIELKFLISPTDINKVQHAIVDSPYQVEHKPTLTLANAYYDTPENALRHWDFGLRTRTTSTDDGNVAAEQTVKLSGQDVAGLQQRPEFTVAVPLNDNEAAFANLSLFDTGIWPEDFPAQQINQDLNKVFETTFERKVWNLHLTNGALVECVLDQGQIEAEFEGEMQSEPLCELELELIEGKVNDLFEIAYYFTHKVPAKLGLLSKAARGYHLAQGKQLTIKNLETIEYKGKSSLEPAFVNILNYAVEFIQHNEIVFAQDKRPKSFRRIMDGVSLVIQVLELFKPYLPETSCELYIEKFKQWRGQASWIEPFYQLEKMCGRKSPYRNDMESSESILHMLTERQTPNDRIEQAIKEFSSAEFNQMFLEFIQWLSNKSWRSEMPLENLNNLTAPIKPIAEQWLDEAWHELKDKIKQVDLNGDRTTIENAYWALAAGLLTGVAVSGFYAGEQRLIFRSHLLNILLGLEEAILLSKLRTILMEDNESDIDDEQNSLKWLNSKQTSLNMALTVSIDAMIKLKPYW
ncbi:MAG: CYTH domain-containing protein [Gammaproteobacteria bacterium]|nr:CYTH domain-containing protein [Gammaproteobacteria bacterium]